MRQGTLGFWTSQGFSVLTRLKQNEGEKYKNRRDESLPILFYKNCIDWATKRARLAQLVERKAFNLVVVGSSPTAGGL